MPVMKSGPLDAMLGARIQVLRVNRGISQSALADRIGCSFQQVQKYEWGVDRVGTGRLAQIASALSVSVAEFFEPSRNEPAGLKSPIHLLAEPGAWRFLRAHAGMSGPRVRSHVVKQVEDIADRDSAAKVRVVYDNTVDLGERRKSLLRR